jgi:serine/threonine protein kinase
VKVADLGIAKKMDDPGIAKLAFANRKRSRMSSKGLGGSLNQLWLSSNKMIGVFSSSRRLLNTEQRRRHSNSLSRTNTFVGTVTYMSPERLDGAEYGYSSDVWSFGLSLLALALGRFPLECIVDGNRTKGGYWTTKQLVQSAVPQLPADADFSQDFRNFLTHCMALKADDRPTCRELLQHPFLRKAAESVNQLRSSHSPGHLTQSLQELRSIILAIYTHIKQIKVDYCGSLKSWTTQQHNTLDRKVHQKIFGNVVEDSPAHILSKVLFGRTSHVLTPEHSSSNNKQAMYRRPRLHMLAKQLNLPVDVAMKGANEVYEFLRLQEDNERQEMMRRSRGEFVPQTSWGPESVSREPSSNSWVHALA